MKHRLASDGPMNPGCVQEDNNGNPSSTGLFMYCTQIARVPLVANYTTAITDGLYGAPQSYACGSVTFNSFSSSVSVTGGGASAASCGPSEPIAPMMVSFPASNTPGSQAIGQIPYTGLYCYGFPACTPDNQTGWFAEVPGTENGPYLGPGRWEIQLQVFDGPCIAYAQDFVNSGAANGIDPMLLAAMADHESTNYDNVGNCNASFSANNPGGRGCMSIDVVAGPKWLLGAPDSLTLNPAWNIEAGAEILANPGPSCSTRDESIVSYNNGPNKCGPNDGYYPACTDDSGNPFHYLQCVYHHIALLQAGGWNTDCAGPPQPVPNVQAWRTSFIQKRIRRLRFIA